MLKVNSLSVTTPLDLEYFDIKEIQLIHIAPIPFKRPFFDATMGPFYQYSPRLLKIRDHEGFWGECEFPLSGRWVLENLFIPILLESPQMSYSELYKKLYWNIRNEGFRGGAAMALGHLDRIFYDLAAKRHQVPVHRYLGADTSFVTAYASGGGINLESSELIQECLAWEDQGYKIIKMKFGTLESSIQEDIQRIAQIREVLRPETKLAVDANQCLSLDKAIKLVGELSSLDIFWLEEPIHSAALTDIEVLCQKSTTPISYGESERAYQVFPSIIRAGVKHIQPIAGHICSIREWLSLARLADEHRLQFSGGGVSQINAPFIAAAGPSALLEYLEPVVGYLNEIWKTRPQIIGGRFILSDTAGIGVEVDWERLRKEKKITAKQTWK